MSSMQLLGGGGSAAGGCFQQRLHVAAAAATVVAAAALGLDYAIYKGGGKPRDSANRYQAHHPAQCRCEDRGQGPNLEVWGCPRLVIDSTQTAFVPGRRHSRQCLMPS